MKPTLLQAIKLYIRYPIARTKWYWSFIKYPPVYCRWCTGFNREKDALQDGWKHEGNYWYCAIHK